MVAEESFAESPFGFQVTNLGLKYSNLDGDALVQYYSNGGAIVRYSDFLPQKIGEVIQHLTGDPDVSYFGSIIFPFFGYFLS